MLRVFLVKGFTRFKAQVSTIIKPCSQRILVPHGLFFFFFICKMWAFAEIAGKAPFLTSLLMQFQVEPMPTCKMWNRRSERYSVYSAAQALVLMCYICITSPRNFTRLLRGWDISPAQAAYASPQNICQAHFRTFVILQPNYNTAGLLHDFKSPSLQAALERKPLLWCLCVNRDATCNYEFIRQ